MIYRFACFLVKAALGVFFRRIEVEGLENVPASGPVLIVANHTNALVDPLVIAARLPRPVTLTARSTLTSNLFLSLLFRAFRIIPFYRREDPGVDPRKNLGTFEECRRRLAHGEAICLFPEGQSHSDPGMRPFRAGLGRIIEAWLQEPGPGALMIVPVGLIFEDKDRLRSAVWVRFGPALDAAQWRAAHPESGHRELTAEVEERVRSLTLNFRREHDSVIVRWASEVLATHGAPPPRLGRESMTLAERVRLTGRLKAGYEYLEEKRPVEVVALAGRVDRYGTELQHLGVLPSEVYLKMHAARAAFFLLRELELMVIGLPLALWGAVNHVALYAALRFFSHRLSHAKDQRATSIIFPGLALLPAFYAVQIVLAWIWLPAFWAAVYTVSLPYCGLFVVLYSERVGGVLQRSRTFLHFALRPSLRVRLREEGRAITEAIFQLAREVPEPALR